jgi:hypothetical protein
MRTDTSLRTRLTNARRMPTWYAMRELKKAAFLTTRTPTGSQSSRIEDSEWWRPQFLFEIKNRYALRTCCMPKGTWSASVFFCDNSVIFGLRATCVKIAFVWFLTNFSRDWLWRKCSWKTVNLFDFPSFEKKVTWLQTSYITDL